MICAVLLQNQAQDSVVLWHQILYFQLPPSNLVTMVDYSRRHHCYVIQPTYLLADWSCYATSFSPSSSHRP